MLDRASLPPLPALVLGAAGIVPPILLLGVMLLARRPEQDLAFRAAGAYGAVVLSFLGGAWWGIAAARSQPRDLPYWLGIAVLPALAAWGIVVFLRPLALGLLSLLFLLSLWMDRELARRFVAPRWWVPMRVPLSLCMAGLYTMIAVTRVVRQ